MEYTIVEDTERPTILGWTEEGLIYVRIGKVNYVYRILSHKLKYWATFIENTGWPGLNSLKKSSELLWYGNLNTGKIVHM